MVDHRAKNTNWWATDDAGKATVTQAQLAVLMDIRDELQGIRRRLDCTMFLNIPNTLADIRRNTDKKRKRKTVKRG